MPRATATLLLAVALAAGCRGGGSAPARPAATSAPSAPGPSASSTPSSATSSPAAGRSAGWGPARLLANLADQAVVESSGLAASRRHPDRYWTHNDSGDAARLFCFDRAGASCGTWPVTGAEARDWEDMAAGPGPEGDPTLFVGDIGDNGRARAGVTVHLVAEPEATSAPRPLAARSVRLTYPDGAHDAEALLVHPATGDLYVVTKEVTGRAGVYKAAAPLPLGGEARLVLVADVAVPGPVTGGDIAPDGTRVALCTYLEAVELTVPPGAAFDAVWGQAPAFIALPFRRQGEAIAYRLDGAALLTTSEGVPAPVHEVTRR